MKELNHSDEKINNLTQDEALGFTQTIFDEAAFREAETLISQQEFIKAQAKLEPILRSIEQANQNELLSNDDRQYFSFSGLLDKLLYLRIEKDPRELIIIDKPFDQLYALYALCLMHSELDPSAALGQAIRWNPANCAHRLAYAELKRKQGDMDAALSLAYSVFERAHDTRHLVLAYLMFAQYFIELSKFSSAAAVVAAAHKLEPDNQAIHELICLLQELGADPLNIDEELADRLLDEHGLPEGASIEVVFSLLICSDEYKKAGDKDSAQKLYDKAVALVGEENASVLLKIVCEQS